MSVASIWNNFVPSVVAGERVMLKLKSGIKARRSAEVSGGAMNNNISPHS